MADDASVFSWDRTLWLSQIISWVYPVCTEYALLEHPVSLWFKQWADVSVCTPSELVLSIVILDSRLLRRYLTYWVHIFLQVM